MNARINSFFIAYLILSNLSLQAMVCEKTDTINRLSAIESLSLLEHYLPTYFTRSPKDIKNTLKKYLARLGDANYQPSPRKFKLNHPSKIISVSLSKKGDRGLLHSEDAIIILNIMNLYSHRREFIYERLEIPHTSKLVNPRLSLHGGRLLTCKGSTVLVWDLTKGPPFNPIELSEHEGEISALCSTPNGRWVISGCTVRGHNYSQKVYHVKSALLWDLRNLRKPIHFNLSEYTSGPITSACISDDSNVAILGSNIISILNLKDKDNPSCIRDNTHTGPITSVLISKDGNYAVTTSPYSAAKTPTVIMWKKIDGVLKEYHTICGTDGPTSALSDKGGKAATSAGVRVRIWDLQSDDKSSKALDSTKGCISALCIASHGKDILIGVNKKTAIYWQAYDPEIYHKLVSEVSVFTLSRCGRFAITGGTTDIPDADIALFWDLSPRLEDILNLEARIEPNISAAIHLCPMESSRQDHPIQQIVSADGDNAIIPTTSHQPVLKNEDDILSSALSVEVMFSRKCTNESNTTKTANPSSLNAAYLANNLQLDNKTETFRIQEYNTVSPDTPHSGYKQKSKSKPPQSIKNNLTTRDAANSHFDEPDAKITSSENEDENSEKDRCPNQ